METKVISSGILHSSLPRNYIRPQSERPKLSEVADCENVPVIDLGCGDRSLITKQIADACREYGFFQVINHGLSKETIQKMLAVGHEFFSLPVDEKPSKTMRLSTSFSPCLSDIKFLILIILLIFNHTLFNKIIFSITSITFLSFSTTYSPSIYYSKIHSSKIITIKHTLNVKKETVHNWRDYLRLHCYPLEKYVPERPTIPSSFKDIASNYCMEVRQLGFRLQEVIAESLGLDKESLKNVLGEQGQHMAVNYYPPCPEPELTYGLPAHTDPNALTILLQDLQVAGLQVLKDGKWLAIKPHPDAFVINIGDQLQALSNGKYKSVWHRAVVNSDKPRLSVASFLCPCDSATIVAPKALTNNGSPSIYRDFTYAEYYKKFWSRNLDQEHCLELFKN